jgi:hypothetical protein
MRFFLDPARRSRALLAKSKRTSLLSVRDRKRPDMQREVLLLSACAFIFLSFGWAGRVFVFSLVEIGVSLTSRKMEYRDGWGDFNCSQRERDAAVLFLLLRA